MIETRPYFVFGDLISCLVTGALTGGVGFYALTWVPDSPLGIALGMGTGMFLGMGVGAGLGLTIFQLFFGAFEVMIPGVLSGILAGMMSGMSVHMQGMAAEISIGVGSALGAVAFVFTYALNAYLTRRPLTWTT